MKRFILVCAVFAMVVGMGSISLGDTLRWNLGTEPPTLDPALATDTTSVLVDEQLFLGLTDFDDETAEVVPELASEWSVSGDGLTYTFRMREDVKWTDGRPVTAHDVVYGVKRTLDPATASDYAYVLYIIKGAEDVNTGSSNDPGIVGVEAVDDYTVQFTLNSQAGYFPAIAGMWVARPQPKWAIDKHGDKWTEPENIVTNGPYLLKEWNHGDSILLVKNPNYYEPGKPKIDKIEMVMVTEASTGMAMYENDELDSTSSLSPPLEDMDRIKVDSMLSKELTIAPRLCTYYYGFNNTKPPFDNVFVRKAFSAAIDRQTIVEAITKGGQIPATTFTRPGIFGAVDPSEGIGISYNPEQAVGFLSRAGYPKGEGFPEVTLMHNTSEAHAKIAQAIQQMWKEVLNVDVKVSNQEWGVYLKTLNEDAPHIYRLGWCADYPDANNWLMEVFHSTKGSNRTKWNNAKFDQLVEKAQIEPNPGSRKPLYKLAEQILTEGQAAMAPIYFYTRVSLLVKI